MLQSALLVLADGTWFSGSAIGADGLAVGEVVFNTSMTGYQEILTDPSYAQQLVTFTYPHVGNTGINTEDIESNRIQAAGMIIRDLPKVVSNFRSKQNLSDYLKANNLVAIAEIDTRRLTRILREKGSQAACILVGDDRDKALKAAQDFPGLAGMDLAKTLTTNKHYQWQQSTWRLTEGYRQQTDSEPTQYHVVAYDFGVKHNILRMLVDRGCKVTVVPATTSAKEVLAMQPDGVFLSNGPGDPEPCDYAIEAIKQLLAVNMPLFGICLGHQLLALASGAKTIKMKFGHHGANHPVKDLQHSNVMITSQNHGFAVDESSLPSNVQVTHKSLFDGSLQGIHLQDKPAFGFQGHPEASPGPQDCSPLFDHFIELMEQGRQLAN